MTDRNATPTAQQRDADGRLVGLSFDSHPATAAGGQIWLIAVDGSPHSQQAVAEAIRLAGESRDCRLHLVHVQHWLSREAAESELARRGLAASAEARQAITDAGLPWRLHVAMGEYADTILRVAGEQNCRGLVIGHRGLGATASVLIGSVALTLLERSPYPVLVAGRSASA